MARNTYELQRVWGGSQPRTTSQILTSKREALRLVTSFRDVALVHGQQVTCIETGEVLTSYGMSEPRFLAA